METSNNEIEQTLVLAGIPMGITERELADALSHLGAVRSAQIDQGPGGRWPGTGTAVVYGVPLSPGAPRHVRIWGSRLQVTANGTPSAGPATPPAAPPKPVGGSAATVSALHTLQPLSRPLKGSGSAEAEVGRVIPLQGEGGQQVSALVAYSEAASWQLIDQLSQRTMEGRAWSRGRVGAAVIDQLTRAAPLVASGLQLGQVFQVVGPQALQAGLQSGAYAMMQNSGSMLGTVQSVATGKIVGQLRFAPASLAPIMAPVLVWQVVNAIAGAAQLKQINHRLDVLQRTLERIHTRDEARDLGQIRNAILTLEEISDQYYASGRFTVAMVTRLSLAEETVGSLRESRRVLVDLFSERSSQVSRQRGRQGAHQAATLIDEEGQQVTQDMQVLTGLMAASLRIQASWMCHDIEHHPEYVQQRTDKISAQLSDYKKVVSGFPAVQQLEAHARACVDEMGWWQRNVWARGLTKRVRALNTERLEPLPSASHRSGAAPSYLLWREPDGQLQAHIVGELTA